MNLDNLSLSDLSRLRMDIGDVHRILGEVSVFGDRELVLICTSLLEAALEALIERHFVAGTDKEKRDVFEQNGPLATFASKTCLARLLGIIPPQIANDLNKLRRIRNEFAHSPAGITLQTGALKDLSKTFTIVDESTYLEVFNQISNRALGKIHWIRGIALSDPEGAYLEFELRDKASAKGNLLNMVTLNWLLLLSAADERRPNRDRMVQS